MRTFLNAWLRRWAEASLRNELHQAQEKLIRQQEINLNILARIEQQKDKLVRTKKRHSDAVKHDSSLIKALKERMSDELFMSIVTHVKSRGKS